MTFDEVQARILDDLPGLSAELRKAARFLVDFPDDVALSSMRVIAERSGVTPTTLLRLARRLGFDGWVELRQPFADRLRLGSAPFASRADALVRHPAPADIFAVSLKAAGANARAAAGTEARDIAAACAILERARSIHVAGFRSCRAPALAFVYLCRMFRRNVGLLGADGGALEIELAGLGPGAAVLCIGFAPYSRELGLVIGAAERRGVPVVAITDSMAAPIARAAGAVLRFSVDSPSFFPSVAAAVAVAEALATTLLTRQGPAAAVQIRHAEAELRQLGAYLPD